MTSRKWITPNALLMAGAVALLAAHAAIHLPFLTDDALISLRYAERLITGQGLTWNDGVPRVEGYSNLLWVLLSAGLGWLGMDLVLAVRLLGFAAHVGVLAAFGRRFLGGTQPNIGAFTVAALAMALSPPVAVWTIGGLEAPLIACLAVWAVLLTLVGEDGIPARRHLLGAGFCLGLLCLTRPDGPIFVATTMLGLLIAGRATRSAWGAAILVSIIPALSVAGQLAFRLLYYGEWVPNTALVKISPSAAHAIGGAIYAGVLLLSIAPAVLLAGWHCVRVFRIGDTALRLRTTQILLPIVAWLAYLVYLGGDIFPAWRHGVPVVCLIALLCGEAVAEASARLDVLRSWRGGLLATAAFAAAMLVAGYLPESNRNPFSERWEWDNQLVGAGLKRAFGDNPPTIAVDAAGAVPFWSGFPAIDMLGLNDHHIARTIPVDFGTGRIGHEKGDGAYVLALEPDMVLLNYDMGIHPVYRSGLELIADPGFLAMYSICRFVAAEPEPGKGRKKFYAWVRRDSPSIGYRPDGEGNVRFPVHFFAGVGNNVANLGWNGRVTLRIKAGDPGVFHDADIEPGAYTIVIKADGPVAITLTEADTGIPIAEGTAPLNVILRDHPGFDHHQAVFDAGLSPADGASVTVESVVFMKQPGNSAVHQ